MKIKIGNLYPYELALYGENGNLKALKYALEQVSIEVEIINIEKKEPLDIKNFDMLYLGSGRKQFIDAIKERLLPYKNDLLDFIKKDRILLATGNSVAILEILGLYEVEYQESRKVADVVATSSLCNGKILGFQNTEYLIKSTNHLLFNMESGFGNNETNMEGYFENNFYATTIIGPLLARNDNLTKYFVDKIKESLK